MSLTLLRIQNIVRGAAKGLVIAAAAACAATVCAELVRADEQGNLVLEPKRAMPAWQKMSPPRALLITSMPVPKGLPKANGEIKKLPRMFRPQFKQAPFDVEHDFRKFFAVHLPEYELEVVHAPNAYEVWELLSRPGNTAVFWVSHAGGLGGPGFTDIMADYDGYNVEKTFQWLHPDTGVLAVVGCNSAPVVKKMTDSGYFSRADIMTWGLDDLSTEIRYSFRQSLKDSLDRLRDLRGQDVAVCPRSKGVRMKILRQIGESVTTSSLVQVSIAGKLIHIFPKGEPGELQSASVWVNLPLREFKKHELNLKINTEGSGDADPASLGDFVISADIPGEKWELALKPGTNEPMGVHQKLYLYKGATRLAVEPEEFQRLRCEP